MFIHSDVTVRLFDSRSLRRSCREVRGAKAPSIAHFCDPPKAFLILQTKEKGTDLRRFLSGEGGI